MSLSSTVSKNAIMCWIVYNNYGDSQCQTLSSVQHRYLKGKHFYFDVNEIRKKNSCYNIYIDNANLILLLNTAEAVPDGISFLHEASNILLIKNMFGWVAPSKISVIAVFVCKTFSFLKPKYSKQSLRWCHGWQISIFLFYTERHTKSFCSISTVWCNTM